MSAPLCPSLSVRQSEKDRHFFVGHFFVCSKKSGKRTGILSRRGREKDRHFQVSEKDRHFFEAGKGQADEKKDRHFFVLLCQRCGCCLFLVPLFTVVVSPPPAGSIVFEVGGRFRPTAHLPEWRNWQTRKIQVLVQVTGWRFKSSLGHSSHRQWLSQEGVGPVGALLHPIS